MSKSDIVEKVGQHFLDEELRLAERLDQGLSWRQLPWLNPMEARTDAGIVLKRLGFDIENELHIMRQIGEHIKQGTPQAEQVQDIGAMFRYLQQQAGNRFIPENLVDENKAIWNSIREEAGKLAQDLGLAEKSLTLSH